MALKDQVKIYPFHHCQKILKKRKNKNNKRFKLAIVKSELIKELKKILPKFFKQRSKQNNRNNSLKKLKETLERGDRVELETFGTFRQTFKKLRIRRNPKTGQKVNVPKKKTIKWKMSKDLFKKLNNEERKIFVACDSGQISKIKKIISKTQNSKIKIIINLDLNFFYSKSGRKFSSLN